MEVQRRVGQNSHAIIAREKEGASAPAEELSVVEGARGLEKVVELSAKSRLSYPRVGDVGEIVGGLFRLLSCVPRLLSPWRFGEYVGYLRNLGNEVETNRVEFESSWCKPVTGVLCRPKGVVKERLPALVLSVGIDQRAEEFMPLIGVLAKQGYTVFAPDSRTSMGEGPGDDLAKGDVDDLINAVKFMQKQDFFDRERGYVLVGGSIGGARSVIAAGRMVGDPVFSGEGAMPRAVISIGAYASMEDEFNYLRGLIEAGKPVPEFAREWVFWVIEESRRRGLTQRQVREEFKERSPLTYVGRIPASIPILVGHGLDDWVIPASQSDKLVRSRPENTRLVKDIGGGIHTVMDVLTGINPYRLQPRKFTKKFVSDMITGHKTVGEAVWYLVDDVKDIVGLGLTVYELDKFIEKIMST